MAKHYTPEHILKLLKAEVESSSQAEVARRLHFTRAYISDILAGRREISGAIAECYGFRRLEVIEVYFTKL